MNIYIDLDGVVANFLKSVCNTFHRNYEEVIANWPKGEHDTAKVLGITKGKMWSEIDKDKEWWANIEPYPWKDELIKLCHSYDKECHILSAPHSNPLCLYGKGEWLRKHTKFGKRIILTSNKYLLARPDRVLIDDNEKKINAWTNAGGIGILFPSITNMNHSYVGQEMEYVRNQLDEACERYLDTVDLYKGEEC